MLNNKYIILLPLLYMFIIFIMSSIPGDYEFISHHLQTILNPSLQNFLHILLFGFLALLLLVTFRRYPFKERPSICLTAIISMSYGILDEVHQYFIPGRYMSLTDIYLNILGILIAIGVYKFFLFKNISVFRHSVNKQHILQ